MAREDTRLLAVLIDADNVSAAHAEAILAEIATLGEPGLRRVYGDWSSAALSNWKKKARDLGLVMHQQSANTKGKNASDIGLVIDAMDILHGGRFDAFVLVSSDSDFTRLASRIREDGLVVYGFGERKTPKPFVAACDTFIYVENLTEAHTEEPASTEPALTRDVELDRLLSSAVDTAAGDDGWANLGAVGSNLSRLASDFDSRSWGYKKLKDLMEAHPSYQVASRSTGDGKTPNTYVRRTKTSRAPRG